MLNYLLDIKNKNSSFLLAISLLAIFYFLFFFMFFDGFVSLGQAAGVSFDAKIQEIKAGQLFEASIFINSGGEEINAIEGGINFPSDLLEIKQINDGNSIINLWIKKPKSVSAGQIVFSGIIPGGYNGTQGLILSLTFLAKKEGRGVIEFASMRALRNDGLGSEASLTISNFQFLISERISVPQLTVPEIEDQDLPEEFTPQIAADPTIFDGKWFLVFATQDKGSGIDYYAIYETKQRKEKMQIKAEDWIEAESPYLLKDQKLRSYIYVKAVDKAGNERIMIVEPKFLFKWYKQYEIWGIIILAIAIAVWIIKKVAILIKGQRQKEN